MNLKVFDCIRQVIRISKLLWCVCVRRNFEFVNIFDKFIVSCSQCKVYGSV